MNPPVDFEISAINVNSFLNELDTRGLRQAVEANLSADARNACSNPMSSRWYPGAVAVEIWSAVLKQGGPQLLEDVNYALTRKSFGPIVGPLVKVGLALSGRSPATIFSRLEQLTSVALRNVAFAWAPSPPNSGVLTITYPRPMPKDVVEHGWRGIIRVGAEMTGRPVRVEKCVSRPDLNGFEFHVSW